MQNHNRTLRQQQIFPIKLTDDIRSAICLRIAFGFTAQSIRAWLKDHGIEVGYSAIRKFWKRKRWIALTNSIRANIVRNPEAKQMICEMILKWLDKETDAFRQIGIEMRDELRKQSFQNPDNSERYRSASIFLVQKFNRVINRACEVINSCQGVKRAQDAA